jgi:hypothetical protein
MMDRKKIMAAVLAYIILISIYVAFFSIPVTPAYVDHSQYMEVESGNITSIPDSRYIMYIRGSLNPAILVIATVRTPYIPSKTYSSTLKYTETLTEEEVKKRYGVDIDLVYRGEKIIDVNNHTIVMDEYDVYLNYPVSSPLRPKVIKLDIGAYFCHEKFESIIIAYAYPPIYASDFEEVISSIHC